MTIYERKMTQLEKYIFYILGEGFLFNRKRESKYHKIDEYIARYPNSKRLQQLEETLKKNEDTKLYQVYQSRFLQGKDKQGIPKLEEVTKETGLEKRRVIEKLNSILICFEVCVLATEETENRLLGKDC